MCTRSFFLGLRQLALRPGIPSLYYPLRTLRQPLPPLRFSSTRVPHGHIHQHPSCINLANRPPGRFFHRDAPSKDVESQSGSKNTNSEPASESDTPSHCAPDVKPNFKEKLLRRRKAFRRALLRLKSRFALFKIFVRHHALQRSKNRLSVVKRYLLEKKLKFGAIPRNALHRKRMRELKEKMVKKSTALQLGKLAVFSMKKYGKLGAAIYFGVYVATLLLMNVLTFGGVLSSSDLRKILERINVTHFQVPDMESNIAKFTVAYIATKVVEPIRLLVSILLVMAVNFAKKRL
ncbi:hypothetical protein, conserved [Babesia bigemina]|uniref:DUF1279 domain-containing protein n=1 Tax=Babesia bigemina TaxID=5866 RepID=A0A061D4Y7_BABBI|nr:hypothetical protein, conserved [Babesia bigemina]CDR94024.1 hypothetical protein, conserved [Babesia bigemina]|eukprot:XP_012766210.1 hypothetical protein, conserved [Babesia bigemina]